MPAICTLFARLLPAMLAIATIAAPALAQPENQPVLIGVIASMTLSRGQSSRDAAQFAVDEANRQDVRIGGRRVRFKLFVADDKNDVNIAALTARAAVAAGVAGVVGHYSTDASIAAAPIYRDAGIPQLSPTAAGRDFTKLNYPTIFQLLGNSDSTSTSLARSALEVMHAQRIVVVDNNTALGTDLAKKFTASLQASGRPPVAQIQLENTKTSDFNTVMAKIQESNADLVFFAGIAPQSIAFSLRMQQLGMKATLLLASGAINGEFPRRADEYAEGTLLLAPGAPVDKMPDYKRLEKAYHDNYAAPLIPQSWFAYDAVNVLIEAMKQVDSTDPKLLSPVLRRIRFNGMSGPISFDAEGNLNNPRYTLYRAGRPGWKEIRAFP